MILKAKVHLKGDFLGLLQILVLLYIKIWTYLEYIL